MKLKYLVGLVLCWLSFAGCGSQDSTLQLSVEARFELGMKKFNDGDYLDAIEDFRIVTLQYQGSALADDAQFYIAECRFRREEYVLAAYEYEILLKTMPTSPFVPRARFQRALCFYNLSPKSTFDQEYTRKAIDEFQNFLEYHPTDTLAVKAEAKIAELNSKLAKKEYENGLLYMKMEIWRSAIPLFDLVLEKYHDTPYAEKAQLKKAEALYNRKRYGEAKEAIDKFFEKYPKSDSVDEAKSLRDAIAAKQIDATRNAPKDSSQTAKDSKVLQKQNN